eukprot:449594_1
MQQSFQAKVVQSNLTDCSQNNDSDDSISIDTPCIDPNTNTKLGLGHRLMSLLILIPPVICTIILFIWSFIQTAAWLHMKLNISNPSTNISIYSMNKDTYNLSIQKSINDLWSSKSYGIAIGILLFSFLFPIIKLLYILFLILSHSFKHNTLCIKYLPQILSPNSEFHARVLFILELFNKYSFINIFILVILMSCIYININGDMDLNPMSNVTKYFPYGDTSAFNVVSIIIIEPDLGIVLFGIAMITSCIITIFIKYKYISFYRLPNIPPQFDITARFDAIIHQNKSLKNNYDEHHPQSVSTAQYNSYNEPKSPLLFSKNYSFRTFCFKMTSFVFFIFVIMGAITLFIAQIAFIEIEYIGEIAPYITNPSSKRIYSFNGIVQSVDIENNDGNTKFLRIIYELFGIVFPLITILLLTILWLIPMPKWIHIRLKGIIWWTHMLNAMDVIIISCILIQQELPQTFNYIVHNQYSQYCNQLTLHFGNDTLCQSMDINIYLRSGIWVAIVFYICLWIVVVYSVCFSHDNYSQKQWRKLKFKIKKAEIEDQGGAIFDTIDENKTL